jgi:hypothetical protein
VTQEIIRKSLASWAADALPSMAIAEAYSARDPTNHDAVFCQPPSVELTAAETPPRRRPLRWPLAVP